MGGKTWFGRLVKMTVLPKTIYTFSAIPLACFAEIEPTVKFMWTLKGPSNNKTNLEKEPSWTTHTSKLTGFKT